MGWGLVWGDVNIISNDALTIEEWEGGGKEGKPRNVLCTLFGGGEPGRLYDAVSGDRPEFKCWLIHKPR